MKEKAMNNVEDLHIQQSSYTHTRTRTHPAKYLYPKYIKTSKVNEKRKPKDLNIYKER